MYNRRRGWVTNANETDGGKRQTGEEAKGTECKEIQSAMGKHGEGDRVPSSREKGAEGEERG